MMMYIIVYKTLDPDMSTEVEPRQFIGVYDSEELAVEAARSYPYTYEEDDVVRVVELGCGVMNRSGAAWRPVGIVNNDGVYYDM